MRTFALALLLFLVTALPALADSTTSSDLLPLVNQQRALALGKEPPSAPLVLSQGLEVVAMQRAHEIVRHLVFSHYVDGKYTFPDFDAAQGIRGALGENIAGNSVAINTLQGRTVTNLQFVHSPEHLANMHNAVYRRFGSAELCCVPIQGWELLLTVEEFAS